MKRTQPLALTCLMLAAILAAGCSPISPADAPQATALATAVVSVATAEATPTRAATATLVQPSATSAPPTLPPTPTQTPTSAGTPTVRPSPTPTRTTPNVKTLTEQLIRAAEAGDTSAIARLLGEGAEINGRDAQGRTPVMAATHGNRVEAVRG